AAASFKHKRRSRPQYSRTTLPAAPRLQAEAGTRRDSRSRNSPSQPKPKLAA
uniref:Uncharacterized protein n=1 Tax=Cucumis melo TaxID=3656 RepID=A0A9I9E3V7_CUCME